MNRSTKTLAGIAAGVALVGGSVIGITAQAQAHEGEVQATCQAISAHLKNYPQNSTITGTIDGKSIGLVTFGPSYDNTIAWDPKVNHTYSIDITSGDGDKRYNKHFAQEVTGCASTPTPTPSQPPVTETPTPTPTTPPVTETPKPSESPKPSSTPTTTSTPKPTVTSTPSPSSSTPSKPAATPKPTPSSSTTATEAPAPAIKLPVVSG